MTKAHKSAFTRRNVIKSVGASAVAGLAPLSRLARANTQKKQLRILRWKNFVPASEEWFSEVFVKEWGAENDIEVLITNVGLGEIDKAAAAEVKAGAGHDLVLFVSPRAALEDHVIDHREIFQECQHLYGKASDAIQRSCFNPVTDKFHGFPESLFPTLLTYRRDLWDAVGKTPNSWDDVRKGGRAIKLLHETPAAISIAPEHNSEHSLRALLYSFGGFLQNAEGQVVLNSANTVEALNFAKALYEEAMIEDVLSWNPSSNNQFMLAGRGNLTIDTMSVIRAAENKNLPVNSDFNLALLPEGPHGRLGPMFGLNTFVIWKFAENKNNAMKFLIDYLGRFQENFVAGGFQNVSAYPGAVPDFEALVRSDPAVADRYLPLLQASPTFTNIGYPGYSNAAIDEVMGAGLIPKMFASVVTGSAAAKEAAQQTSGSVEAIFEKWREAGKI